MTCLLLQKVYKYVSKMFFFFSLYMKVIEVALMIIEFKLNEGHFVLS
jgi:hypothetical protein